MSSVLSDCRCGAKAIIATNGRNDYSVCCTKCLMRTARVKDKFIAIACWNNCMREAEIEIKERK